jgi:hypothetical protein
MTTNKWLISGTLARRMLVCVKDYEAINPINGLRIAVNILI